MKKNTFLYILLALVVFFFVFGMGRSVYEGFVSTPCTLNSQCPKVIDGTKTYCGGCPNGFCGKGKLKGPGVSC
jgi:hypothetical protein